MKHCVSRYVCLVFFLLNSSKDSVARNSYFGQTISPETIGSFIEPLPEDAAPVIAWIEEHAEDLHYLAATPSPLSRWADKKYYGKQCLKKIGIENNGSNNFVFKVPGTNWWIKISGPLRRLINLYVYNTGKNPFSSSEYKLHREFSNASLINSFEIVPTFQTISRFANSLLCKDVIARHNIDRVYFPEIYLVHIPGNPIDIKDDNYIIVEREVPHIENICTSARGKTVLTKTVLKQLYYIITRAGIFDFNGENLRIDEYDNLVFIDLEQSIVENPADFYNTNKEICDYRVLSGIRSFINTHLEKNSAEYEIIKSLVMEDTYLQESRYYREYKKLFSLPKNRHCRQTRSQCETKTRKKKHNQNFFAESFFKYNVDIETLFHCTDIQ